MSVDSPFPLAAPVAARRPVIHELHGDRRPDEYFWLRERHDPEVLDYLAEENLYAEAVMGRTSALREQLYHEMLARIEEDDVSVPYRRGELYYYQRTEAGKQYPLYARKRHSLEGDEELLLDVNELAQGKSYMSIGQMAVSDDGHLLAYTTDDVGYRQYTLHIKDLRTGEHLGDTAARVGTIAWAADDRTLFYTVENDAKRHHRVHRHTLGSAEDALVFEEPDERFYVGVSRTRSRGFVLIACSSHTTSDARLIAADRPHESPRLIAPRRQDVQYQVEHRGDALYLRVNDIGRNFRVVKAPIADPSPERWVEVVPHRADVLVGRIELFESFCVLHEVHDALRDVCILDLRTGEQRRVPQPEAVYVTSPDVNVEFDTRRYRFTYESPVTPPSVYELDLDSGARTLLKRRAVLGGYDPDAYQTERSWATAPDGTRVPISLVRRKDRPGPGPCLLYGYGSYGHSSWPRFRSVRFSLIDRGVTFAIAHVRGGSEMGKAWHDAGRMQHKMNTFTDFVACADYLVEAGHARRDQLAIMGGSAGGLLVSAAINLRPDLCKAVVSLVPFVDVVTTMLDDSLPLTVIEYEEWGNPNLPDEYRAMRQWCPYSNLAAGAYPAMLVRTSLHDSQVMYWEPAKYVARMRAIRTNDAPLLLRTNMEAGHGGASGRYDMLREVAYDYAFVLEQLGAGD